MRRILSLLLLALGSTGCATTVHPVATPLDSGSILFLNLEAAERPAEIVVRGERPSPARDVTVGPDSTVWNAWSWRSRGGTQGAANTDIERIVVRDGGHPVVGGVFGMLVGGFVGYQIGVNNSSCPDDEWFCFEGPNRTFSLLVGSTVGSVLGAIVGANASDRHEYVFVPSPATEPRPTPVLPAEPTPDDI
ncbi:MAG: hypothetical protein R3B81_05340 [bacterium]